MTRSLATAVVAVLLCTSCAPRTSESPAPAGTPTPMKQPEYVGIGSYRKLAEVTVPQTFGGVSFISFVEVTQGPGISIPHRDVPGFVYAVRGAAVYARNDGERRQVIDESTAGWIDGGGEHTNGSPADQVWAFVSIHPISDRVKPLAYPGSRLLYSTGDLDPLPSGKAIVNQLGYITMNAGGRTSSHSHGGIEAFFVISGSVELAQNNGTKTSLSAGKGASIRPGTVMQLRVIGDEPVQILTYFVTPEGAPWQNNLQTLP